MKGFWGATRLMVYALLMRYPGQSLLIAFGLGLAVGFIVVGVPR